MLVEFRVKNFRSIKDEQVLSMVAGADKKTHPENVIGVGKHRLLRSVAIYGPNASGKSNVLIALRTLVIMVDDSADYKPGTLLPIDPFLLDAQTRMQPSTLEITFLFKGKKYQYGFTASKKHILEEWLCSYSAGSRARATYLFKRFFMGETKSPELSFSTSLKGAKTSLVNKTRNNALFLSVGAKWGNQQLGSIYEWINKYLRFIVEGGEVSGITKAMLSSESEHDIDVAAFQSWFAEMLAKADVGVVDFRIRPVEIDKEKFFSLPEFSNMSATVREELFEKLISTNPETKLNFVHENKETGDRIEMDRKYESAGTDRLVLFLGPLFFVVWSGCAVAIDEIDKSLHPNLSREIVKYMHGQMSKNEAQMIFTTHDVTLLDSELFRRDQIYFTEKDNSGATSLYSLTEFKDIRKDESFQRAYLSGRFGALPILEAFGKE